MTDVLGDANHARMVPAVFDLLQPFLVKALPTPPIPRSPLAKQRLTRFDQERDLLGNPAWCCTKFPDLHPKSSQRL